MAKIYAANRLIYDTLMFVVPPTLVATTAVWIFKGHKWSKDLQRLLYYAIALFGMFSSLSATSAARSNPFCSSRLRMLRTFLLTSFEACSTTCSSTTD